MDLSDIRQKLAYKHKRSALKYLVRHPALALFMVSGKASELCFSKAMEGIMDSDLAPSLLNALPDRFLNWSAQRGLADPYGERLLLYLVVRKFKPDVVVETGVARGALSAFVLCGMDQNDKGQLYSIDLPPYDVPGTVEAAEGGRIYTLRDGQKHVIDDKYMMGELVPGYLRKRWHLTLGDARRELRSLLQRIGGTSIFLHDSLHTYEQMMFEYETAWPYIHQGGLLLSHDVLWSDAFLKFSRRVVSKPVIYRNLGVIRKR